MGGYFRNIGLAALLTVYGCDKEPDGQKTGAVAGNVGSSSKIENLAQQQNPVQSSDITIRPIVSKENPDLHAGIGLEFSKTKTRELDKYESAWFMIPELNYQVALPLRRGLSSVTCNFHEPKSLDNAVIYIYGTDKNNQLTKEFEGRINIEEKK